MFEKIKNKLKEKIKNPYETTVSFFFFAAILALIGYDVDVDLIKYILYTGAISCEIICISSAMIFTSENKNTFEERRIYNLKPRDEEPKKKEEKTNDKVIILYPEMKHATYEEVIEELLFIEYLIKTIGYSGYELDLEKINEYRLTIKSNTGRQEVYDRVALELCDFKEYVCENVEIYYNMMNPEPKVLKRHYGK